MKPFVINQSINLNLYNVEIININHLIDKNNNNVSICNFGIDNKPLLVELTNLKILSIKGNNINVLLDEKTTNMISILDNKIFNLLDNLISFDENSIKELNELSELTYSSLIKTNTDEQKYLKLFINEETQINEDITIDKNINVSVLLRDLCIKPINNLCCVRNIIKIINVQTEYKPLTIDLSDYVLNEPKQLIIENLDDFKTMQEPLLNNDKTEYDDYMNYTTNENVKNDETLNTTQPFIIEEKKTKRKYNKKKNN